MRPKFQTSFQSWKRWPRFFKFFVPFLYIKRHQKNTPAKVLEKIALWQHALLNTLHKFVKQNITKSQFKSNISALCLTASYHIFLCKDEPTFLEPPFLLPPLVAKRAPASEYWFQFYTYVFFALWDQQPVLGQCNTCLNPLSGCLLFMANLFVFSTALAVLFTLVDSGIDVYTTSSSSSSSIIIDSFDCSKLLNRVETITQTRPD